MARVPAADGAVQARQITHWVPALCATLAALAFLGWALSKSAGDPLGFATLGTRFSLPDPAGTEGYDGQFNYYIAVDPSPAAVATHLDIPAYRYQRILYPMAARLAALGQPALIAWALPLLNLLFLFALVWQTGALLADRGGSAWPALLLGLWAGVMASVRLDLAEPLALLLVVIAWRAAGNDLQRRALLAAVILALAMFAKETSIGFVLGFAIWNAYRHRWSSAAAYAAAVLPFVLFQGWLWLTFGALGIGSGGAGSSAFVWLPFQGLWSVGEISWKALGILTAVYLPGLLFPCVYGLAAPILDGIKNRLTPEAALLFVQALMVALAPFSTFREPLGILRLACGMILCLYVYAARRSVGWWNKAALAGLAYLAFLAG
jgi:hypothetical protein